MQKYQSKSGGEVRGWWSAWKSKPKELNSTSVKHKQEHPDRVQMSRLKAGGRAGASQLFSLLVKKKKKKTECFSLFAADAEPIND